MKPPPTPSALTALHRRLEPLMEAEKQIFRQKVLAAGFGAAALAALIVYLIGAASGLIQWELLLTAAVVFLAVWCVALIWTRNRRIEIRDLARRVEAVHPDMQAVLLTALDQQAEQGRLTYLQQRVISDAVRHGMSHDWRKRLHGKRGWLWDHFATCLFIAFVVLVFIAYPKLPKNRSVAAPQSQELAAAKEHRKEEEQKPAIQVEVRPGDTEVERQTRLVVEAKFSGGTPARATIVLSEDAEGKQERERVPMRSTVESSAYGGVVKSVDRDGFYRVEYDGGVSPIYRVTTYVHPELVRSDAIITPPAYAGLPVREVKNTLTISVMEGSQVRFRMTVNKPISEAELYGEDKTSIPLKPTAEDPLVLEGTMTPGETQKYRLHLVDADDRGNKQPPWIKVTVIKDQPPRVDLVFPKRDLAVSPLQEMPLEAKVWDDVGVERTGAVFLIGSETKEVSLSEARLPGKKSHDLRTMLALEQLKVKPRQLVSYYVWAEDHLPQGGIRRTQSDMFFAEVRHFEDIFREGEGSPSEGQGNMAGELVRLQKEVVNATWRLIREMGAGKKFDKLATDMKTVRDGQRVAQQKTEEALEQVEDAEMRQALLSAIQAMKRAFGVLDAGLKNKDVAALQQALGPEREALEYLGMAQSQEHRVMRAQSQSQGQGQQNERQIMDLELTQKEKLYEEEKEAGGEEQTAEQQENLQVLNRLKELARRQEALAEKIKDLEEQLAKAKTEEERAELNQQLKRLQEEQEQLLRDLDELQERMEKPENQQNMAEELRQLQEAREQARQASENLAQQQAGAAANDATRAQEKLEEVRDEFRKRTARRFAEEMRSLKEEAAALEEGQKKLAEALASDAAPDAKPGEGKDAAGELKRNLAKGPARRQVDEQKAALDKLLQQMQQISEQAESSEQPLSTALHDAVRKAHSDGIEQALEETKFNLQAYGSPADAQSSERKAAQGIEELKRGIDRAAESVLGSETEALRMARNELDRLLKEASEDLEGADADGKSGDASRPGDMAEGKQGEDSPDGKPGGKGESENKDGEGSKPGVDARRMAASGAPNQQGKGSGEQKDTEASDSPGQGEKPGEGNGKPGDSKEPSPTGSMAGNGSEPSGNPSQEGQQQQPGAAQQPGQGQQQASSGQQGQGEGQSQPGQGQQPSPSSQGQIPTQGSGQMAGAGQPKPDQGQGASPGENAQPGEDSQPRQEGQAGRPGGRGPQTTAQGQRGTPGSSRGGGSPNRSTKGGEGGPGGEGEWFFNVAGEEANNSPLTGSGFGEWSDRLRRVEEALENEELKGSAAGVLESARQIHVDNRRNDMPPQSDIVRMKVLQPLAELRDRVAEELARLEQGNPLAPLDRDPVPPRYRELVRRYYKELGGGK